MNRPLFYRERTPTASQKPKPVRPVSRTECSHAPQRMASRSVVRQASATQVPPQREAATVSEEELEAKMARREKVARVFYNIRIMSRAFSLLKFLVRRARGENVDLCSCLTPTSKDTVGTLEMLEQSLEKYEKISHAQIPQTRVGEATSPIKILGESTGPEMLQTAAAIYSQEKALAEERAKTSMGDVTPARIYLE